MRADLHVRLRAALNLRQAGPVVAELRDVNHRVQALPVVSHQAAQTARWGGSGLTPGLVSVDNTSTASIVA